MYLNIRILHKMNLKYTSFSKGRLSCRTTVSWEGQNNI